MEQASGPKSASPVCPYCGESHPSDYTCREWARLTASGSSAGRGAAGFTPLPPRPNVPFELPSAKPLINPMVWTALRVVVVCLALFGAVELAITVGGHFAVAHRATHITLPACTTELVSQNLVALATIESEADLPSAQRIDATNQLVIGSGPDCTDQVFGLYTSVISNQTLCFSQPNSAACRQLNTVRTQIAQALNNGQ